MLLHQRSQHVSAGAQKAGQCKPQWAGTAIQVAKLTSGTSRSTQGAKKPLEEPGMPPLWNTWSLHGTAVGMGSRVSCYAGMQRQPDSTAQAETLAARRTRACNPLSVRRGSSSTAARNLQAEGPCTSARRPACVGSFR